MQQLLGPLIYLALIVLSVTSWVIVIYKFWLSKKIDNFARYCEELLRQNKHAPLNIDLKQLNINSNLHNPFLSLYSLLQQGALSLLKKNRELAQRPNVPTFLSSTDIEQLSSQIEMKIYAERKTYEKYLFLLPVTFSAAPLLGLLGTVWGISLTLKALPQSANALSNGAVLSGLSVALGTTVWGIVVAICALIPYNFLKNRIEGYTVRMNQFSTDLLHGVELQYRAVDVL